MLQMLQDDRSRSLAGSESSWDQGEQGGGLSDLVSYAISFLRRQYLLILFVAALAVAASVIYLRITPPTYTARAKVLFVNPKTEYFQQQSILADSPLDRAAFENQLQILKSKAIAIAVINQFKLADDPDFDPSAQAVPKLFSRLQGFFAPAKPAPKREVRPDEGPDDFLIDAFEARLKAERMG